MHIATAHYANPTTGASATVVLYASAGAIVVKAYIDPDVEPRWEERVSIEGDRQVAVQSAECWGGIYALRLTNDYGMQRVA